jgi:hypothetical protein
VIKSVAKNAKSVGRNRNTFQNKSNNTLMCERMRQGKKEREKRQRQEKEKEEKNRERKRRREKVDKEKEERR